MSKTMLTIDESEALSACNRKQRSVMHNMLESVPDHLSREDIDMFELKEIGDCGTVGLYMRVMSDNGLLSDKIHLIVNSHGKIKVADCGSAGDLTDKYDTVNEMKIMIRHHIEEMGSWME